jgi:hypothetical protein
MNNPIHKAITVEDLKRAQERLDLLTWPDLPEDPRPTFYTCNEEMARLALKAGGIAVYAGNPDRTPPGELTRYVLINPLNKNAHASGSRCPWKK